MSRKLFLYINILLVSALSYSQIPGLTQFTINNGLPSNTVYDITQDSKGYIWLATDYGISKFDGLTFTNYTVTDGLPDNEILYFYKDNNDRIWLIGFNSKIGFIKDDIFFNENNYPSLKEINLNGFPNDILNDTKGNILFLNNDGVYIFDSKNNTTYIKNNIILNDNNSYLFKDSESNIHIITHDSFVQTKKVIETDTSFKPLNYNLLNSKTINRLRSKSAMLTEEFDSISRNISSILFNKNKIKRNNILYKIYNFNHQFWVTNTKKGAAIFAYQNEKLNKTTILPNYQTTKAYLDNEGNVWIGSLSDGVTLFPNQNVSGFSFKKNLENDLHSILVVDDLIYIGNSFGEVTVLNKSNLSLATKINLNVIPTPDRVRKIKLLNKKIYALSDLNIYNISKKSKSKVYSLSDTNFSKISLANFKDITSSSKSLYLANSGGVGKINSSDYTISKIWKKRTTSINYCTKDSIWIGTTNGLYLKKKDTIVKYQLNKKFDNTIITDIKKIDDYILLGTNSNGLGVLQNKKFIAFGQEQGLLSNYIKSIHIAEDKTIWISTNFGLSHIAIKEDLYFKKIGAYTISEGLYSNDIRACFTDNNKAYVATSNGLNIIDLKKGNNPIPNPKIYIDAVFVNNKKLQKKEAYSFNHHENNIQFNYSGISFKSIGNISFKYRLKGIEKDWIETKSTTIRYSALSAKDYTFEVQSLTKNGNTSLQPATFSFTINRVYYKTWWFYSILGVALLMAFIAIIKLREKKAKKNQAIKENISNLKFKALNAQMSPHFINNLLSHILELTETNKNDIAIDTLIKFTTLVNLILKSTAENLISLNEELKISELYLELQSIRFNKGFDYHINTSKITDELNHILVPPMLFQPIIENAITHGIRQSKKMGEISLHFYLKNDNYLYCEIVDNGIGYSKTIRKTKTNGSGISLKNINERLQLINHNTNEDLLFITTIKDEFNNLAGTKIILKIPLIIK